MKRLFILFILLFAAYSARSQAIVWDNKTSSIDIDQKVSVLEDKQGNLTIDQVSSEANESKFHLSDQKILNFGFSTSAFWLRFSLDNPSQEKLWLVLSQAMIPTADMYFKNDKGEWQTYKSGYRVPLDDKVIKHHFQIFPLPKKGGTVFVRFLSYNSAVPVNIWRANDYEVKAGKQKIIYGVYTGLLLFVICYNLFLFVSLRNTAYLYYSIVVACYLVIAAAVMDGYILYLFPNVNLYWTYRHLPQINAPFTLLYCMVFLDIRKYSQKLWIYAVVMLIYLSTYNLWQGFLPILASQMVNTLNALVLFSSTTILAINVGKSGNRLGYYYAMATGIWFALIIMEAIYGYTGWPPYFIRELSHVHIAILVEVFLLSYLLSKRFEWEKEEMQQAKSEAQAQLLVKTQENEKMVREQNTILEQQVEERTHQLRELNQGLNTALKTAETERGKAETLLLNILPEPIAQELKDFGFTKPQTHQLVTVLFADIEDFTRLSSNMPPDLLVSELNDCFEKFDMIVQEFDIEKIKTIGDAYMAAGGLLLGGSKSATDVVRASLKMQEFMIERKMRLLKEGKFSWDIRIGIDSGTVVAGVVGKFKFAYDIWGDTVNTASRMQMSGEAGKVNISAATYDLIKDYFVCKSRGNIDVKGKGDLQMYWVEAERQN